MRTSIKRVIGLPGDTVEVRGGELILNGRPVPREPLRALTDAAQRQQPVQGGSAGHAVRQRTVGGHALLPLPRLSAKHCRTARAYTVLDQVDDGSADDFAAGRGARRATSS